MLDLSKLDLRRQVGQLLSREVSLKIEGVCIGQPTEETITVAVVDPTEVSHYELIEVSSGHRFKAQLVAASGEQIHLAQEYVYLQSEAQAGDSWAKWLEGKRFHFDNLGLGAGKRGALPDVGGHTVELAERLIKEAISVGASDIHLENYPNYILVRFRQDGALRLVEKLTREVGEVLVNRFKVMGHLDVTQDRRTQTGRISLELARSGYDLRVSLLPVPAGESLVLRILHKSAFTTTLEDLGFSPDQLKTYSQLVERPYGLLLTCGPTGSGKSTTLYASLKSIQRPDRKLLTVEDPIEYEMPDIVQVQVDRNPRETEKHVTFASTMREFLRHDPDVILVGEIRDEETAHISVQAALTGHLVLSTLHTNDSVGVIHRLRNQGIPAYLVASVLIGSVAQRLVRRICPDCREPIEPTAAQRDQLALHGLEADRFYVGKGCESCLGGGYRGRIALYEILRVTAGIRDLIEGESMSSEIWRQAREEGMQTLLDSGLEKAVAGLIPFAEVARVCSLEVR